MTDQAPDAIAAAEVTAVAAIPEVTADMRNKDGTQNIYITGDPELNGLTLTLTNGLGKDIEFPRGTPLEPEKLPPGQSAIYFYFNGLIDNADVATIKFSAPGWTPSTFVAPDTALQCLVIAPDSLVTVPAGGTLTFTLTNVLVPDSSVSGTADIQLAGATGVMPVQGDVPLYLSIVKPPRPDKQTLSLQIGFTTAVVYTGGARSLLLHLTNGGDKPLVPGGTGSWEGKTPTFQLTLVYGSGPGALTTIDLASHIDVSTFDQYGNVWDAPARHEQGDAPYWTMQPSYNGGGTVLGTGQNASIEFQIKGIETTLPAELPSALALAYVSWKDIPGYNDGFTAVLITKRAGPRVITFTADPAQVPPGENSVRTMLSWDTKYADGVHFDAPDAQPKVGGQTFTQSGIGPGDGLTVPWGGTVTLIAYKNITVYLRSRSARAAQAGDESITATKKLTFPGTGGRRTDITAAFGSLGRVIVLKDGARALVFQKGPAGNPYDALSKAAILDIATRTITGTLDLGPLPSGGDDQAQIGDAVLSPDGTMIYVIASLGTGDPNPVYLLPLRVADLSYGSPVRLPTNMVHGRSTMSLWVTPDGGTVYATATDGTLNMWALDTTTYAQKLQQVPILWGDAPPYIACGVALADGGGRRLLLYGQSELQAFDASLVWRGLSLSPQVIKSLTVSPDARRAYCLAASPGAPASDGSLLVIDTNLDQRWAPMPAVARTIPLGQVPGYGSLALSPDGQTLYAVIADDRLTAFDTTTFAQTTWVCGVNGQFRPVVIASTLDPKVFLSSGQDGRPDSTITVITLP